jgi:hypothetical protein
MAIQAGLPESGDSRPPLPITLIYLGVVVGMILILIGIALMAVGRGSLLSSLMTCVGFGLVLAALGATASGSWAGWTVGGAGALALVLFFALEHFQPDPPHFFYKTGQIRGDLSKVADIRIVDDLPMYEYRDRTTNSIRFVVLDRRLKSNQVRMQVDTLEKGEGKEFFELTGDAHAIQNRYLADSVDSNSTILWTFDYSHRVVRDGPDLIFSEQDTLVSSPPVRTGLLLKLAPFAVAAAHAENAPASPSVSDLLVQLKSDDTSERRNARDALSALGPSSVTTMMSAIRADPTNYRTKLGVIFALSEMLRHDPNLRTAVSAALITDDFPILVAAASDEDKTIRLQAAEFLYLLQDPRAVASSVEAAKSATDESKATNQALIIRQSAQSLAPTDKAKIINDLEAGKAKNIGDTIKKTLGW